MAGKYLQTQATTLYGAGSVLGATSIILSSLTDLEGNTVTMTDVGTIGFGTIEPGTSAQEEAITFTGITQNDDGTATLTGVKNQLGKSPYTQTSGIIRSHAGGTIFVVSNTAGFYNQYTTTTGTVTTVSTATHTVATSDQIILVTANCTVTLPAAATMDGVKVAIKKVGSVTVSVVPTGVETIDGAASFSLPDSYSGFNFFSNGANWFIL